MTALPHHCLLLLVETVLLIGLMNWRILSGWLMSYGEIIVEYWLKFIMEDFNSPMVIDSNFLRKSYKMVSSIKSDGMDYF